VDDVDLKTMLDAKAEEMRLDPHLPPSVLRRARRRRAANAILAGTVTVGLAIGAFVGARALLDETASAPPEIRPGGTTEEFSPFIYPSTLEELEVTQEQVAEGSMPMWTEPEGVAILFAVNVMGWDMEDVLVEVMVDGQGEVATISNGAISEAPPTTLHLLEVPGSEPSVHAVLAAVAEGIELEPEGPDVAFGAGGRVAFRGRLSFVPQGATVVLSVDHGGTRAEGGTEPDADGRFRVGLRMPNALDANSLISIALQDGAGRIVALTSARLASPVAASEGEMSVSEAAFVPTPAAAETREAIVTAARERNFRALRALIPDEGFTFTFGGETDPIRYWKRLESEGHVPVIGDVLPGVLGTEPGFDRGVFVWPAQATEDPAEWDGQDIEALTAIHAEEDIRAFQEAGLYLGWRVGIDRHGTWLFFVAGD
jgi:hypothetical protein